VILWSHHFAFQGSAAWRLNLISRLDTRREPPPRLLLKRQENLGDEQRFRLRDLLRYNLKTVRAYLLKEAFQQLWDYPSAAAWAAAKLGIARQTLDSKIAALGIDKYHFKT
jgi:hypothetical protein